MAAVTICSDFGAPKNKVCHCFHFFPIICHEVMELDVMILFSECWALSQLFHSPLSLSSLSAIRVVLSAYLRLLICQYYYTIEVKIYSRSKFVLIFLNTFFFGRGGQGIAVLHSIWDLSYPTRRRDQTCAHCIGSAESYPLLCKGSPTEYVFYSKHSPCSFIQLVLSKCLTTFAINSALQGIKFLVFNLLTNKARATVNHIDSRTRQMDGIH